jgi:hypothetical protein
MLICFMCYVTYEEQHPNAYFMLRIVLFNFMLILMPLGPVTQLSVTLLYSSWIFSYCMEIQEAGNNISK